MKRPPPRSTPCPQTTLFRSAGTMLDAPSASAAHATAVATIATRIVTGASCAAAAASLRRSDAAATAHEADRKSTRLNSSHGPHSYAGLSLQHKNVHPGQDRG